MVGVSAGFEDISGSSRKTKPSGRLLIFTFFSPGKKSQFERVMICLWDYTQLLFVVGFLFGQISGLVVGGGVPIFWTSYDGKNEHHEGVKRRLGMPRARG